ncbi:MAG: NUDIX hydrolase [Acholeplasmataceae bacterium]|nr:NUDIX hydrolase [Acholeplasmataceae bacterium]
MRFCPDCGHQLNIGVIENRTVKSCSCGFIDWNNWVNVSAVVVAFNENQEFMMVRVKHNNTLTFPGGYRELGESFEQAAKREFFEETGHMIDHLKLFNVYTKDDLRLVWVVFTARILGGHFIPNEETSGIAFQTVDRLPDEHELRGSLTKGLLVDICKNKKQIK